MGQQDQALQRSLRGKHTEPVFDFLFFLLWCLSRSRLWALGHGFGHRAFGKPPAFRSRVDATVAGAMQGGTGSPMDTDGHRLDLALALRAFSLPTGFACRALVR